MSKVDLEVDRTKKDLRDNVVQAIADLEIIISSSGALTLAQLSNAVRLLAKHQKIIIKQLARMVA
jgi:hypothetical protein